MKTITLLFILLLTMTNIQANYPYDIELAGHKGMIRVLSRLRGRLQPKAVYQRPETRKVQSRVHNNKIDGLIRILKRNGEGRIRLLNQQGPNFYPTVSSSKLYRHIYLF